MEVNRIVKKYRVNHFELVRFQLLAELVFLRKEVISPADLEILALLALWGPMELKSFCDRASEIVYSRTEKPEVRSQNVRNRMVHLERRGFVDKSKRGKKVLSISPALGVEVDTNLLVNYNLLALEPAES